MLVGLMDHWVPSHDAVSRFWKTPLSELRAPLERICDMLAVDNYTFYTKWYTNGVKSSLPFLRNHPDAMNTVTDNAWGRELIEFLHERGLTVGAMLQCYGFDDGCLPREGVLGRWNGTERLTADGRAVEVADPLWDGYPDVLAAMLEEQLGLFPDLDQIFLEFEGLGNPETPHRLTRLAEGHENDVSETVRLHFERTGVPEAERAAWIRTAPVQDALRDALATHLARAEETLDRLGYEGVRGVVYHAFGYEDPYIADVLPSRDWWLLPWHYWGWEGGTGTPDGRVRTQVDYCKERFAELVRFGHRLCYIGNASLPSVRPETVVEMVEHLRSIDAAGHLGMGNFIPEIGLRWHGASEPHVAAMRELYRFLFPKDDVRRA